VYEVGVVARELSATSQKPENAKPSKTFTEHTKFKHAHEQEAEIKYTQNASDFTVTHQ